MELSSTVENRHTATDEMQLIFEKQRIAFNAQPYPDYTNRRHKLIELKTNYSLSRCHCNSN